MPRPGRNSPLHRKKPDALAKRVGERIRAMRLDRGITFDAFVEETGVGRGYVSELERGLVVPNLRVLAKVAEVLEVTMADLVAGDSSREKLFESTLGAEEATLAKLQALLESAKPRN